MRKNAKRSIQSEITVNPDTTPILYTDEIHITSNEYGFVLDIVQKLGDTQTGRVVSRIGMSREHAESFTQELGSLLLLTEKKKDQKLN